MRETSPTRAVVPGWRKPGADLRRLAAAIPAPRAGASRSSWLVVATLSLLVLATSAVEAARSAAPQGPVPRVGDGSESPSFLLRPDGPASVRWRLVAHEPGLRIRLYVDRGTGGARLLAEQQALVGDHQYVLSDRDPRIAVAVYELRWVDETGAELSLGLVVAVTPNLGGRDTAVVIGSRLLPGHLAPLPTLRPDHRGEPLALAANPAHDPVTVEVPTPPPRHA